MNENEYQYYLEAEMKYWHYFRSKEMRNFYFAKNPNDYFLIFDWYIYHFSQRLIDFISKKDCSLLVLI